MDIKEIQTKKEAPILESSTMLTRFKLSQQKRQLREKDNSISLITQSLKRRYSVTKSGDGKKSQKSSKKSKKEKQALNVEKTELHPNKLKRNKVVKKIVLKQKNDLKVIGWTNAVKRKRKRPQKTITSPNGKRKENKQRKISLDSNFTETDDRSQSPVYSELGFEEVLRMADENEILNDEDLMEILTCPSPVWWEDLPDEEYMEGPIVIKTNTITSLPDVMTQRRSKQSRKRTPQKMIIEPVEGIVNDDIVINEEALNTELLNKKKTDVKFNKKRSKLESLLQTIKTKVNQIRERRDNNKILTEETKKDEISVRTKSPNIEPTRIELEVTPDHSGDSSFLDISLLDIDGLKHLENLEIPIERNTKTIEQKIKNNNERNNKNVQLKSKIIDNKHFKIIKNDKTKAISKIKNKKLKILNVKNVSPGVLTVKSTKNIKNTQNTNKSKEKDVTKSTSSLKTDKEVKNVNKEINKSKDTINLEERKDLSETNLILNDIKQGIDTANDYDEFITVFEIINSDEEITEVKESDKNETETLSKELDKSKLNTYYKKCKNSQRALNKIINIKKSKNVKNNKKKDKLCDDCNSNDTIIVPDSNDVKYCLKCSSIFDADICSYCNKKEK